MVIFYWARTVLNTDDTRMIKDWWCSCFLWSYVLVLWSCHKSYQSSVRSVMVKGRKMQKAEPWSSVIWLVCKGRFLKRDAALAMRYQLIAKMSPTISPTHVGRCHSFHPIWSHFSIPLNFELSWIENGQCDSVWLSGPGFKRPSSFC